MVYGKIKRAFPWGKDESPLSRNKLDYAGAFDAVANHLILTERKDKVNGITAGSRNKLLDVIRSADKVFGVLEI
jgi:hypothetical protein